MPEHDPFFGVVAPEEGWVPSPSYLLRRDRILRQLATLPPGLEVLEVGCGAGALLADLRRMGHRCSALETSPDARSLAGLLNRADPGVRLYGEPTDHWIGRFDVVAAFEVLEHIEDDRAAFRQWATWVKPRGHVILSVPAGPQRWDASDEWAGHVRRYTRQGLCDLVTECGFEIRAFESYGFPLANIIAPVRAAAKARLAAKDSIEARTAASGIERSRERSLFPFMNTMLGRQALSFFLWLQGRFASTDRGTGYLVLAQRR